jgi:signal transduction histidine kinase
MAAEPFEVSITEAETADLRERLPRTRWPEPEPVDDWSQGLPLAYAQELCRSWTEDYDFGFAGLVASRARIVAAANEARRRIQRDLHDGTQQQLVSLMLDLRQVQAAAPPELEGGLSRIADRVTDVFDQVREISHGIHPAILSEHGLTAALKALARRSAVPVELDLRTRRRLPDQVEVTAYYAISEALANAAKHARASVVHVELDTPDTVVRLAIRDDGIGGADAAQGSGLVGLRDRIEAAGGTFDVTSPAGHGTTLLIEIPV